MIKGEGSSFGVSSTGLRCKEAAYECLVNDLVGRPGTVPMLEKKV